MAKITAEALAMAAGWNKFGEKLGWKLQDCTELYATFIVRPDNIATRHPIRVYTTAREDIERTWREQDKPTAAVIKAVTGGAG